jgi:GTP-binding protein Era
VDVTLPVARKNQQERDEELVAWLESVKSPAIMVLNKVDLVTHQALLPLIKRYAELYPFTDILPVSGLKGEGVDKLLGMILTRLPKGPRYFPEDIPTDATERFLCAEIIREKVFLNTGQEIPYQTAVMVESFKEDEAQGSILLHASVVVDRDSQKGIVIGKGGSRLKKIGTAARKDMENLLGSKVHLKLWVKVKKNWAKDNRFLRELGL